ncbi:MAG TPA: hypothetical protein VFP53_03320 [Sphingomicrobium sp.]|nr:hypothetical protein [Sphingomicrobium sp.]
MPSEVDPHLLALLFADARSMEAGQADDFACVSLKEGRVDHDPPASTVTELSAQWRIPVVPGSRCRLGGSGDFVVAPGTTGTGKWLRVTNFQCSDARHCTADVSYYVANLGAGGRSVTIERTAAGWRVTPSGMMWIS